MLVSVTALGTRNGDVDGAARAVIAYLDGRHGRRGLERPGPDAPALDDPRTEGVSRYYADSVEGPGHWIGHGVAGVTMAGEVDKDELRRLLLGQDPRTGLQLRPNAAAVQLDERLSGPVSLADAAALVGMSERQLRRVAIVDPPGLLPPGQLRTTVDDRGHRMVDARDLRRWQRARAQRPSVIAYDVTFSAPKSVSILWSLGDERIQLDVLAAVDTAVAAGMDYLERHAAFARPSGRRAPATGLLGASYLHGTSRALDPQLHRHVVVANIATVTDDGTPLALDGTPLFAHAKTAGYIAAAELRFQLTARLGVTWGPIHNGLADIDGIPADAIAAMSTRSRDIERAAAELGTTSAAARQVAAYATRDGKDKAIDPDLLRPWWHSRLADAGLSIADLDHILFAPEPPQLSREWRDELLRAAARPEGITELAATFDRRDVIQWLGDHLPTPRPARELEHLADQLLASDSVFALDRTRDLTPAAVRNAETWLYTTHDMAALEARIADRYTAGLHTATAVVPREITAAAIARRPTLGEDQAAVVRAITTSGHRTQCVLGPAGTGKTFALEVAAWAWTHAGYDVIGAAVQGTAAEVLGRATGIPTSTVASLLTRLDTAQPGHAPINERTVVLIDEASTLGNRDLDALLAHCERAGAALRLVGDPAQHSAVTAGGAWRWLVEHHPEHTPQLTELRRQAAPDLAEVRLALTDYRTGQIAAALERLERDDRVVSADTADELLDALVADWYLDRRLTKTEGTPPSSMVAEHHRDRRELNRRARALLVADGTLHGPVLDACGTSLQAGDEVIARLPDRSLRSDNGDRHSHVRNGTRGTVVAVNLDARALTVDFEHRGPVTVPWSYLSAPVRPGVIGGLAHSYALTSHAAQGETYGAGRHLATDRSTRKGVYVGLTRGRDDVRLYTVRHAELHPPVVDDDLPRIPDVTDTLTAIGRRLQAGGEERIATELDPAALHLATAPTVDVGDSNDPIAVAWRRLREQRIAERAVLDPDDAVLNTLGPRPPRGPARRSWDRAVRADAQLRAGVRADPDLVAELFAEARVALLRDTHPRQLVTLLAVGDTDQRIAATAALDAQVRVAATRPAPYLIDLLGAPTDTAEWFDAAQRAEAYRHRVLGLAPTDGALPGSTPAEAALGPRPPGSDLTLWDATPPHRVEPPGVSLRFELD